MTGTRKPGKKSLPWLTPLILLVIAALAGLGLVSLRQDRRAAEQDAELLAKALADSLSRASSIAVAEAVDRFASEVEASRNALLRFASGLTNVVSAPDSPGGQPLSAETLNPLPRTRWFVHDPARFGLPEFSEAPETPDWVLATPRAWLERMESAERAGREGDFSTARTQLLAIVESGERPLRGVAELQMALLGDGPANDKAARLRSVALQFPDATTASGAFVGDLAMWHAIVAAPSPERLGALIEDVILRGIFHPSFFTERLFAALERRAQTDSAALAERVSAARTVWNLEVNARPILQGWRENGGRTGVSWTRTEAGSFFTFACPSSYMETNVVIRPTPATTNVFQGAHLAVTIVPDSIVDAVLREVASELGPRWPRYLAAEFEMAGQRFGVTPWALGTTQRWNARPVLATKSEMLSNARIGQYLFDVTVRLADPDLLYAKQRQRLWIFGALIVAAAGVALVGAWQLQRNLNAQLMLNEQKSNFVSSVSHELRAPIASVRLMAENLERGKISEPGKQHEYFHFIVQECRRLSSLIENVLDFSRIEQGRKQYEFEPTNVTALVEQTVKLMEPYAGEKGVRLELEISNIEHRTSNIERSMDGRAIQQALVNLIDNAIKHSPKGEAVTVGIEVSGAEGQVSGTAPRTNLTPDTSHLTLFVADRGPGIPASEREKIFERFHRLGSELRRETQGVGIGLSIVKHIVTAHGGRVRVKSEVGKGSCLTIELPGR